MKKKKCEMNSILPTEIIKSIIEHYSSSYIEAVGHTQTIESNQDVCFDISEDYLDNVGNNFEINSLGTVITITKPGLYHVEWSVNLNSTTDYILFGLMENNNPSSALTSETNQGNLSSGALIEVTETPYTISLHNFGQEAVLSSLNGTINTAASIRILRFASMASEQ